jgi:hypothetical protein
MRVPRTAANMSNAAIACVCILFAGQDECETLSEFVTAFEGLFLVQVT